MIKCYLIAVCVIFLFFSVKAQGEHSDNYNGTYTNPVIAADFPDPDVIRVGDTYYMVSTTMFTFPGVTILKSHDLVNWQYCANAIQRFDFGPCYDLNGCNAYAHGQWATSFKFYQGKFYLLFVTLTGGQSKGFVLTAAKPEGPWKITQLPKAFYDPGLFFDDDGRIYVTHGYNELFVTEVNKDLKPIGKDSLVFKGDLRRGLEGTHVYKINGYYFLYCTYGGPDGFQVALRSKNIYGPYEERIVLRDTVPGSTFGVHQGALIQTPKGEWWTMLFTDSGPFGRFPSLQPVTWLAGWPVAGQNGCGVKTFRKPKTGYKVRVTSLPTSDEFNTNRLALQWGWNHNPDPAHWSLKVRPGFLRLATGHVCAGITQARNTLTQRPFAKREGRLPTIATVKIDVTHIKNGDRAGLAVFQDPYAYIGVQKNNDKQQIIMVNNGEVIDLAKMAARVVYLRVECNNATAKATFSYSLNDSTFLQIGKEFDMKFSLKIFTGNKFCLFNYATQQTGGYADFDWFRTQ